MKTVFKYALLILIAALLGAAVGGGISWYEYSHTEEHFFENQWPPVDPDHVAPVAHLLGLPDYEFEQPLKVGATHRCEFLFQNDGTSELEIEVADHSPNVEVELDGVLAIRPGVSMPIELKFTPSEGERQFAGWVELKTNDPDPNRKTLRLTVRADIELGEQTEPASDDPASDPGK